MKTAISLPDDVFQRAERLARNLGVSRSQLFARAMAEYLARHTPEAITEALDEVCGDLAPGDDFVREAGRLAVERSEW